MRRLLLGLLLSGWAATVAASPAGERLFKGGSCVGCHATDRKLIGPSLKDIATRYRGDRAAEARLVAKVKNGGAGAWGPVPMPAHPNLKDGDVKALIQYVLTIR